MMDDYTCPNCEMKHTGPDGLCGDCLSLEDAGRQAAYEKMRAGNCKYVDELFVADGVYWCCNPGAPHQMRCPPDFRDCPLSKLETL